ncbi:hypothetical protein TVAG_406570 [Trichomonas vaginalis G3]|uniref:Rab-GAP TBC domain-containing protein n=1 Tax=Trichomonas vaginalis (strain ATCC PRA-98 / G3) TaxID=412133 RepID=A2EXD1_TRIV3|nr:Rab-GTPase-TBC domain family [Trichomonas vaginalis G3]EAY02680.1 hypothetical protein TVAG_406570 [Trichomonas vaginalis G3]KAI5507586.1 Rab-GTPase-TBC domain family [Trichomonas vaginalis G3]|eukprot:XP_001314903.1 hypothetical protein [Trichomonas vaginalis G3]
MTEALLCVLHSARDEDGQDGCLSVYYKNGSPFLSFCKYSLQNSTIQTLPFTSITNIVTKIDESSKINIVTNGQPVPTIYFLKSIHDVYTFFQILVANGIIMASPDDSEVWIPAQGSRPSDPVDWILQHSYLVNPAQFHYNSKPPYNLSVIGTSFTLSSHREILKSLIQTGKDSDDYKLFNSEIDKNIFISLATPKKIEEYLNVRGQWECRIAHQFKGRSKLNSDLDKLSKDLIRISSETKVLKLIYNVLSTLMIFAPDLGYAQGMTDICMILINLIFGSDIECDDKSQSIVFWSMHMIMFEYGQSKWYINTENSTLYLTDDINFVLSAIYPAVATYVSFNNYEVFKHITPCMFTMMARTLGEDLLEKIFPILIKYKSVNKIYTCILITIFILEFPNMIKRSVPDIIQISNLACEKYEIKDMEEFLSIASSIFNRVPEDELDQEPMYFKFELFKPLEFK